MSVVLCLWYIPGVFTWDAVSDCLFVYKFVCLWYSVLWYIPDVFTWDAVSDCLFVYKFVGLWYSVCGTFLMSSPVMQYLIACLYISLYVCGTLSSGTFLMSSPGMQYLIACLYISL